MTQTPVVIPGYEQQPTLPLKRFVQLVRGTWHWLQRKREQQTSTRRLRVAETVSLGEKRFVSIVKVDGMEMLIGVSGASVSLLSVLKPKPVGTENRLSDAEDNS